MFLDALFRAGTGESVEVAAELLKNNKITGKAAELYYLQFAYTKHVTKSALTAVVVSYHTVIQAYVICPSPVFI